MSTDLPEPTPLAPASAPARDLVTPALVFATIAVMALAVVMTIAALIAADDDDGGSAAAGGGTPTHVSLSEFAIDPAAVTVPVGGSLHVTNDGTATHNLRVADADLVTPDLAAGDAAELDVSSLAAGSYELLCEIPGHADAGMTATLTVSEDGGSAAPPAEGGEEHADLDYEQMTKDMLATFAAFPATTEGAGNQLLEPSEVLADGTKVFDLTMELGEWEVSPGEVVEAWTFNGMVPAPMLDLAVGDKVQVRVQNDLPIATDVHWHGINVDNANDGVAPLTQPLIEPGTSFTYSFTTDEQAVAMYHPHAHGHMLLPDGMFGVLLVGDVRLPLGQTVGLEQVPADLEISQEIPMVLNDAGVIGYSLNGKSFPATQPYTANVGDWLLIHYFNEGTQIHPMHLHQFDQIVVAKDGYPIDFPYTVDTLNVAPGERYSVLVQVDRPGAWVWHCHILPHVESEAGMFGMVTAIIAE
ncbi:MAG: multicopper oxidase domain-containing protein [Acidimicrobiales bacterium]